MCINNLPSAHAIGKFCLMGIHIGKIIAKVVKGIKIDNMDKFCQEKLNMTKQNYYRIIREESIHTDTLIKFCAAFNHDFFQYFYEVDPLKSLSKKELDKLKTENADFRSSLERKEDILKDYERIIANLREDLEALKSKSVEKNAGKEKKK